MNNSTNVVIGLLVAIILICSALIPVALDQISALTAAYGADVSQYTSLLSVVITLTIIGLVVGVVRMYTRESRID